MKRLTTDDEKSIMFPLNTFYAKDGEVWVRGGGQYPDFEDVTLVRWIMGAASKHGLSFTAESPEYLGDEVYDALQDGDATVEGIIALMHEAAVQAAEMRARLKLIEDLLGDDYDLELLRKLLDAYRGKRCFIMREPEDKGVSRLRELAFADLDGRCVVFPCSVGQKIYKVHLHDILELTVERIGCGPSGEWHIYAHTDRANIMWKGFELCISQFGFTVFTNHSDAVSALKESCIDKEEYHV